MRIRKTKRFKAALLFMLIIAVQATFIQKPAGAVNSPVNVPAVKAQAAVLMDMDSGRIIYKLNETKSMLVASTTKILTALVVLDKCRLSDRVEIKREWTLTEGSSMYLKAGETYTVEELLYGMMLASGNDAAAALACHTAGSIEAFAKLMNEKAAEIDMANSHFTNPHGLDQDGHYSTAKDMAILASNAMKNREFEKIVSTKQTVIQGAQIKNHNKLLWQCEGVIGVKTGYTEASGRTLVSCAVRGDTKLVCVTLNDPDDWKDHAALYDWGFDCYKTLRVGCCKYRVPVISGTTADVGVSCREEKNFFVENDGADRYEVTLPRFIYAPVCKGDTAGEMRIYSGDKLIGSVELGYDSSVPVDESIPLTFWEKLKWAWFYANEHSMYNFYPMY